MDWRTCQRKFLRFAKDPSKLATVNAKDSMNGMIKKRLVRHFGELFYQFRFGAWVFAGAIFFGMCFGGMTQKGREKGRNQRRSSQVGKRTDTARNEGPVLACSRKPVVYYCIQTERFVVLCKNIVTIAWFLVIDDQTCFRPFFRFSANSHNKAGSCRLEFTYHQNQDPASHPRPQMRHTSLKTKTRRS